MARRRFNSKYLNKKVIVDGVKFDSMKEYNRYVELQQMESDGLIFDLQRQVKFVLIPKQTETIEQYSKKTGKRIKDKIRVVEQECAYFADFVYKTKDNQLVVEDAKGLRTTEYIIKRKLMLYLRNIKIVEI